MSHEQQLSQGHHGKRKRCILNDSFYPFTNYEFLAGWFFKRINTYTQSMVGLDRVPLVPELSARIAEFFVACLICGHCVSFFAASLFDKNYWLQLIFESQNKDEFLHANMHINLKLNMSFYNAVTFQISAVQVNFKVRESFTHVILIY